MTLKKAINSPNQEKDFADKELTHTYDKYDKYSRNFSCVINK